MRPVREWLKEFGPIQSGFKGERLHVFDQSFKGDAVGSGASVKCGRETILRNLARVHHFLWEVENSLYVDVWKATVSSIRRARHRYGNVIYLCTRLRLISVGHLRVLPGQEAS